jgi:hypothetical protein
MKKFEPVGVVLDASGDGGSNTPIAGINGYSCFLNGYADAQLAC